MIDITSSTNAHYKRFLSLTKSKGLKDEGQFILSGQDLISEFLKKPHLEIVAEIMTSAQKPLVKDQKTKHYQLSSELFDQLDVLGTHYNLLVIQIPAIPEWKKPTELKGLTLLAPLGDPTNLGALARSAEAFGAKQIVLLKEACHPFLPKAVKSSAGSILRIPLLKGPSIHDVDTWDLKNLVALDLHGENLSRFEWPKDVYLIVGEEGAGLPKMKSAKRLSIKTNGVESLNATVAASIAMYAYTLK